MPKDKVRTKKKKSSPKPSNKRYTKGALNSGFLFAIFAVLVIMAAGSVMIGNLSPKTYSPQTGQQVNIISKVPEPSKSNLQLYTFPGVTFTPTPTLTPTPTATPPPSGGGGGGGSGGGGGGGSTCFPAGTKILMANHTEKNIESVKVDDKILGYNGKQNIQETVQEVESPIRDHLYKLSLADGSSISLTREHPLFTQNGWASLSPESTLKENSNLKVKLMKLGDKVLKDTGHFIEITKILYIPGNVQTYNLKRVTGYNDFYANDILAHNKGGGGGGSGGGGGGGGSAR